MVKFLSGSSFDGENVPTCTFWRSDVRTNVEEDFAALEGTSVSPEVATENPDSSSNQCIANSFFARSDITCFNEGQCNGSGQCLPCSKYKYGGMRLGISHSPPLEFLRQFGKGLTEEDIRSPNLVAFPPGAVNATVRDQLPLHIIYKNIMAQIAKCCRWNFGDGVPSKFYLATIIGGPDTKTIQDENGNNITLNGILITHPAFPDEVGSFAQAGLTVVAGFEGQPSFYLEPRTGLPKPGDGVIFGTEGDTNAPLVRVKQAATQCSQVLVDTVNATGAVCNELTAELTRQQDYYQTAVNSSDGARITGAQASLDDVTERQEKACAAAADSQAAGEDALDLIDIIVNSNTFDDAEAASVELGEKFEEIAVLAEVASNAGTGQAASQNAATSAANLRRCSKNMQYSAIRSFSKCQFFFEDNNIAEQWNNPSDGTLPCNGVRTDCDFYTGEAWQYATDEKLDIGKNITAEALQEIRFRSDDWDRYVDPETQFKNRFSTPFIWAFDQYVDVFGTPDIEDLILYKPKVLFLADEDNPGALAADNYEMIQMNKVSIDNFDTFSISKSEYRTEPGSEALNLDQPPQFPNHIFQSSVPTINRLNITHPKKGNQPFIYRTWSADKNKLTMFGTATPDTKVVIINDTALRNRNRYNDFLGTPNFVQDLPTALPDAPAFIDVLPSTLLDIFSKLEDEQRLNDSTSPLGYDSVAVDRRGFWQSFQTVDLIHNDSNEIYVFLIINEFEILSDSVLVDYRFLHSIPMQSSFEGKDFSMNSTGAGGGKLGIVSSDITKGGKITAEPHQAVGNEAIKFAYGYMGWRFRNRNLRIGNQPSDDDLVSKDTELAEQSLSGVAVEDEVAGTVAATAYHVVQYQKSDVEISNWYVVDDCGAIMIEIPDITANRVLPLPSITGNIKPHTNALINGGGKGSIVAQFALTEAILQTDDGVKQLVQLYRDADGFGLPANFVLLGPSIDSEQAFGRPVLGRDSISITYTYLQAQTATSDQPDTPAMPAEPVSDGEVLNDNFYEDKLQSHFALINFDVDGNLTAGVNTGSDAGSTEAIRKDQQDYVWVFADSDGRPIGRKVSRMMELYYTLACINVEMYYGWSSSCTTYGLFPDREAAAGLADGTLAIAPKGTIDPAELSYGFQVSKLIGEFDCLYVPSCGDHEVLRFGQLREEFEVIIESNTPTTSIDGTSGKGSKAIFPNAGDKTKGKILSSEPPGSQFGVFRGPLWYPYITCEPPRYNFRSNGPFGTASTELINQETSPPGISPAIGVQVLSNEAVRASQGVYGNLMRRDHEAYRARDRVIPKILDVHPSIMACRIEYTYGNSVLTGRNAQFSGAARRRGEIDALWYADEALAWSTPPFGNFGRPKLVVEVTEKRGDFLSEATGGGIITGFRWMPMFPEREDLGANTDLFGEEMEPQHYRFIQSENPAGGGSETVDFDKRFAHKQVIENRFAALIEYPYISYYPGFVGDSELGQDPEDRSAGGDSITTMWAWREQEGPIKRGQLDSSFLTGIKFKSPEYFLDQRKLEVRLRPEEGNHEVTFTVPTYDPEDGTLLTNASLQLNDGPKREIILDFANRKMEIANQEDTVYDTSLDIGDTPFPCEDGTLTDSALLATPCSCITDTKDEELLGPPSKLPARFLHLDSVAPAGYLTLYESTELNTPFAVRLQRDAPTDPCCLCVYYIRGLYFSLDLEFLPTATRLDPSFDGRLPFQYTWSRPPHGTTQDRGTDGVFAANENLISNFTTHDSGIVFLNRFIPELQELEVSNDAAAIFPSVSHALATRAARDPINVVNVGAGDLYNGGVPATGRESRGEDEVITLDFRFETYVRVRSVTITFFAGQGWQIPKVRLGIIDPSQRTDSSPDPVVRSARLVGESSVVANGGDIPFLNLLDQAAVAAGFEGGVGAKYPVLITPSYANMSFWNQFGMEFHLIFDRRSGQNSMGIAGIELEVEAMINSDELTETIFIPERKYYISTGTPGGGNNPDNFLTEADSATVYWKQAETGAIKGSNKFRAYAFGDKIEDNQPPIRGSEPADLEKLQAQEYNITLDLMSRPYNFNFTSFVPKEEGNAIDFYAGTRPSVSLNMSLDVSAIDKAQAINSTEKLYGIVPSDRHVWHAAGHTWVFRFREAYAVCCRACPYSMVIDYDFAHLHDALAVVETADFWDELPTGFSRLIRSTELSPDHTFGQSQRSGLGIDGSSSGQDVLLDASSFVDSQGNLIDLDIIENAGFSQGSDGTLKLLAQGG